MTTLHESQRAAIEHVSEYARGRKDEAWRVIDEVLRMSNISVEAYGAAVSRIKSAARVALHFHPDRPDHSLKTVAESLIDGGVYKSQFETGLSNGHLSAHPGGHRDRWERQLFGGAYDLPGATVAHRPKYGALDLMLHPDGPAPRFGSCYLLLRPEVSSRCTFTFLNSGDDPDEKGTLAELDDIMAALLLESFGRDYAIGETNLMPPRLIAHLFDNLEEPIAARFRRQPSRNLNHWLEAQVHGQVQLEDDVEAVVADPSFAATETGAVLEQLCERYRLPLHWHHGFEIRPSEVPTYFRGPTMPSLAARVAVDGWVHASDIGRAAIQLRQHPEAWADRGSYADVLQELKLLWHVLVRFGGLMKAPLLG